MFLALAFGLVWFGYAMGKDETDGILRRERDDLAAEWRAMERERQIHGIFLEAQAQLREAEDDARRQPPQVIDGDVIRTDDERRWPHP